MECKEPVAKVAKVSAPTNAPPDAIIVKYGRGPNNEILYPEPLEDRVRAESRRLGKKLHRCRTCFDPFSAEDADEIQCIRCMELDMRTPEMYHK